MELDGPEEPADLRSQRMPSAEGRGLAKAAWEAYQRRAVQVTKPLVEPVARRYGAWVISDLLGFWVMWHIHGGFDGLQRFGMARTTIFRRVKRFRQVFKVHPDEFTLPGITIDVEAYWAAAAEKERPPTES